jgi:hypothetical protein
MDMATTATRSVPPARQLAVLNSEEVIRSMPPGQRREQVRRLHRLRLSLLRLLCGSWFDASWHRGDRVPDGFTTCRCCERQTPLSGMTIARLQGVCDDCAIDGSALADAGASSGEIARHIHQQDAWGPSPLLVICLAAMAGGREIKDYRL